MVAAKQNDFLDGGLAIEEPPIDGELVGEVAVANLPAVQSATPMSLIEAAITQGIDTDKLEKLLALQQRWEADQARKAFSKSMAKFRCEQIVVLRSTTVSDGPLKGSNYAKLADFVNAAVPSLSACGLSATWRITRDEKDWIEVACIVSHVDGHQESTTMGGPPDTGGAKNAIQARASTVSYLEKYTLKMALGLAEQNDDNDGNGGGPDTIGPGQVAALNKELDRLPPAEQQIELTNLLRWAEAESLDQLPISKFQTALTGLRKKGDKFHS